MTTESRRRATIWLFESQKAKSGGVIHLQKRGFAERYCMDTLLDQVRLRTGHVLTEVEDFYLIFCNAGRIKTLERGPLPT